MTRKKQGTIKYRYMLELELSLVDETTARFPWTDPASVQNS